MAPSMILMVVMFIVFWFMLIRPQQKRQREHAAMLASLKKGDQVVTNGGLIGKISDMTDDTLILEVQEKVRIRVLRSAVQTKYQAPEAVADKSEKAEKNAEKADKVA